MKIRATYEDGVLKPQTPLPLPEHAEVEVEVDWERPATDPATQRRGRGIPASQLTPFLGCVSLGGDAVADKKSLYDGD